MTRRFGLALVAAVVIVCGAYGGPAVAQAPTTTAPASASPAGDALDNLAGCVRGSHQLLVLFLIDESGSLQKTDPGRQRVAAAASALDSLASLTATSVPAGERPQVQVAIAGFANAYVPAQDWTALDQQTLPGLRTTVRAFAKRNTGLETDFVNGLQGARDALAAKSALDSQASASQPCKAVLMFTDGKYDVAMRTAANEKELGATKPYAPGIDLTNDAGVSRAIAAGVTALCRPGGLADGLRDDGTTMITVALATQIDKKAQGFLGALSTGQADGTTCGKDSSKTPGAFLPANGIDELLLRFDEVANRIAGGTVVGTNGVVHVCAGSPCPAGQRTFSVDNTLRQVHVLVVAPRPGDQVYLQPPGGSDAIVTAKSPPKLGPVGLAVRQVSDRALAIDLTRTSTAAGWAGKWSVTVVAPKGRPSGDVATIQVLTFSDIQATLQPGNLVLGAPASIVAKVGAPGAAPGTNLVRTAAVTAELDDPLGGPRRTLKLVPSAKDPTTLSAMFTTPATVTSSYLRVTLLLTATTRDGVAVSSSSAATDRLVRRPAGYPQILPANLALPSVTGTAKSSGDLLLVGDRAKVGCVWFDPARIVAAAAGAEPVNVTYGGPAPTSRATCLHIPAGGVVHVAVAVKPAGRSSGSVQGAIRAFVAPATGGAAIRTDVPFRFDTTRGIDQAKRLLLAILLLAGGLLLPVLLLAAVNAFSTRFQDMSAVRGAAVPILVRRKLVFRVDPESGATRPFALAAADFQSLSDAGTSRRFRFGGIEFRAHAPANPFSEGSARAAPEGGADRMKGSEGRRVDLDLALAGSWVFLLDPDATAAAAADESRGTIITFITEGPAAPQTARLLPDVVNRLPETAKRMTELAKTRRPTRASRRPSSAEATTTTTTDDDDGASASPEPDDA